MMHRPHLHHHNKAKDSQRKVTPPGPTYMSKDQFSNYLKDLRTNRPVRPGGSRPSLTDADSHDIVPPRAASAMSMYGHSRMQSSAETEYRRSSSALSNYGPVSSQLSLGSSAGRPLVQEPRMVPIRKNISPSQVFTRPSPPSPNTAYRESGLRRIEKEEARSLRDALQEMDLQDDIHLHQAAQDEATELVWMHQNPGVPYKNPYAPYHNPDIDKFRLASIVDEDLSPRRKETPRKDLKVNFALSKEEIPSRTTSTRSGLGLSNVNHDSSKGIFRNPDDQIYEEPVDPRRIEDDERPEFSRSDSSALRSKPRNALPRGSRPLPGRFSSIPFVENLSRFELHKQPPSQSRNPEYKMNSSLPQPISSAKTEEEQVIPTKDGIEIRSEEIRAATSKKLKDRSSKLPMPTAVSDRVGRPIVSFDPSWKAAETQSRKRDSLSRGEPASPTSSSQPAAPIIQVSEASTIPIINLPDEKEPTISDMVSPCESRDKNPRPLPNPTNQPPKPSPKKSTPVSHNRWLSTYTRSGVPTAKCESCSLPIAGKIVTAAGTRFHPECFVCFQCQTPLECVAFYQEPEAKRNERLAEVPADDEEAHALRFYCHLDFHELYSPRCKSCKTPIEGEVVVACGAEWHVGHFFCAECGDPFNSETPFVEKDGFAWCLDCHSRRTAPRCLGCKKPVLDDVVISAIGGQWHDECFVCHECGDGFGSEGRYFVREGEPKRTAKGRIIGGPVQLAVCERCEGIRLKASPK